jgi:HEAT repeat protein
LRAGGTLVALGVGLGAAVLIAPHVFDYFAGRSAPPVQARQQFKPVPALDELLSRADDMGAIASIREGLAANRWALDSSQAEEYGKRVVEQEARVKATEEAMRGRRALARFLRGRKDDRLARLITMIDKNDIVNFKSMLGVFDLELDVRGVLIGALAAEEALVRQGAAEGLIELSKWTAQKTAEYKTDAPWPSLGALLTDENPAVRIAAILHVYRIEPGEEARIRGLVTALEDKEASVRLTAAEKLRDADAASLEQDRTAVAVFRAALDAPSASIRVRAAKNLHADHADAQRLVAVLCTALDDKEACDEAVRLLGEFGPAASEAVPALIGAFEKKGPLFRKNVVADALGKIGDRRAVPALLEFLRQERERSRSGGFYNAGAAERALGMLKAQEAKPILIESLGDSRNNDKAATASALARLGGSDAVDALIKALKQERKGPASRPYDAGYAENALVSLKAQEAKPILIESLADSRNSGKVATARALARLGGSDAVDALTKALKQESSSVRVWLASILGDLGPEAAEAVPVLIGILNTVGDRHSVWRDAAEALGKIGPAAREAVPRLKDLMREADPDLRFTAAVALGRLDEAQRPMVLAFLEEQLAGEGQRPLGLIPAVGEFGAANGEAVPILRRVLSKLGSRSSDQFQAVVVLGELGPGAKEAIPDLIAVLKARRPRGTDGRKKPPKPWEGLDPRQRMLFPY